jgi:hypothetical protein
LSPNWSQRDHWNVNVIGPGPIQPPGLAVSVEPSCAAPEIDGDGVRRPLASAITACLGDEAAVLWPAEFDAVTTTRLSDRRRPSRDVVLCSPQALRRRCSSSWRRLAVPLPAVL